MEHIQAVVNCVKDGDVVAEATVTLGVHVMDGFKVAENYSGASARLDVIYPEGVSLPKKDMVSIEIAILEKHHELMGL